MLNAPFKSLTTRGCCPTSNPLILGWIEEIAERYTFNDLYLYPLLNRSARKDSTDSTEAEKGLISLWTHHVSHFLQAES